MGLAGILVAVVVCLAAAIAPSRVAAADGLPARQAGDAPAEIAALNGAFWQAFAARDLWAMGRLWERAEDASAIFPAVAAPAFGWDNVREGFKRSFAHNRDIKMAPRLLGVRVAGDTAWLIDAARFEAIQTQTGQPIFADPVLSTKILVVRDGRWRVVHFHAHAPGFVIPDPTQHPSRSMGAPSWQPGDDLERASATFYDAFARHDLAAMVQVWSGDDVSVIHPSSRMPFLGRDQVAASWRRAFADLDTLQISPRTVRKTIRGPIAWLVDTSEFHAVPANMASTMHLHDVLSTQIFEACDGRWRMTHYHGQIGVSFAHTDG